MQWTTPGKTSKPYLKWLKIKNSEQKEDIMASSEHLNIGLMINIYDNYVYEYYKSQHTERKDYKVKF